jgi:DNA repair exonuclease SbcCD nuclease subunit
MSKLYHGADFQLDARQYNHPTRNDDYDIAFQEYCNIIANDPECKGGTILGDLIDHKQRHDPLLKRIFSAMRPCFNQGKTLWFLGGNHDGVNPTMADAIKFPGLKDAGEEFARCLAKGEPFQPYGEEGPNVCALNFLTYNELVGKLSEIRNAETHKSTELWLHTSIYPAVPQIQSPITQTMIHNLGWDTIVAGDTHNPGAFECGETQGKLLVPGSPEMTDINEDPEKGFLVHDTVKGWDKIPYSPRPFKTFNFGDTEPQELQIREVIEYLDNLEDPREPIIKIISAGGWRKNKDIRPRVLILLEDKPKKKKKNMDTVLGEEIDPKSNEEINVELQTQNTWDALCEVAQKSEYSEDSKMTILNVINHPKDPESWGNEEKREASCSPAFPAPYGES